MKTENMSQQNKNKDLFEIRLFKKNIYRAQEHEANVDKFGHDSVVEFG